jgi:carbamate kinase
VREQLVVVALGGNAISPPGSANPIPAQYERTMETAQQLAHPTERPLAVTLGNGKVHAALRFLEGAAAGWSSPSRSCRRRPWPTKLLPR